MRTAADASSHGIGAVIFPNGEEKPIIAYASWTLSSAECNYAQSRKSLVYRIRKFHQFLYGRKFMLVTDHKTIFRPKRGVPALVAARLQRWAIQLSYDIEHRSTDKHANADGLSRLPLQGNSPEEGLEVKLFQIHQMMSLSVTKACKSDRVIRQVLNTPDRDGLPHTPRNSNLIFHGGRNSLLRISV